MKPPADITVAFLWIGCLCLKASVLLKMTIKSIHCVLNKTKGKES